MNFGISPLASFWRRTVILVDDGSLGSGLMTDADKMVAALQQSKKFKIQNATKKQGFMEFMPLSIYSKRVLRQKN